VKEIGEEILRGPWRTAWSHGVMANANTRTFNKDPRGRLVEILGGVSSFLLVKEMLSGPI
jgi:hypothetical protein